MRKLLKLQHHKHTGKLLHHKHTSYRALTVVMAIAAGVMGLAIWNIHQTALADSLVVDATVPADVPTQPSFILDPADGSSSTVQDITVSGSCQVVTPEVIVVIMRGSTMLGSVSCDTSGNFSLIVSLVAGSNQLLPRTVNITGQYGPDGSPVNVTYNPPSPPPSGGGSTGGSTGDSSGASGGTDTGTADTGSGGQIDSGLSIVSDQPFLIFGPNQEAVLGLTITNGRTPYTVRVNWGDGTIDTYHNVTGGSLQQFRHHYAVMKNYQVTFYVTDADGKTFHQSLAAITPYVSGPGVTNYISPNSGVTPKTLMIIAGSYVVIAVGLILWYWKVHRPTYHRVKSPVRIQPAARKKRRR